MAATLAAMSDAVRARFEAERRVLSFREYLELVERHPARHTRDASRYLRDCLDYFGTETIERPTGVVRRFRLFDLPFDEEPRTAGAPAAARGRREHLVGQEHVQEALYRMLGNFAREGRANRLLLLHGPNGSAKSTFAACLMRGLEVYSQLDEGAIYTFSWIFPRGRDGKPIGFGETRDGPPVDTYAHLPDHQVEAKLTSPVREHPLQLLPLPERRALVARLYAAAGIDEPPPDWIASAELGRRNQLVWSALLAAYRGDLRRVLAHVQVERVTISRRYRTGAVTLGPQMAVDAGERQITADRSVAGLPASLSTVALFEPFGELVDAAGGVLEYSDLLKRPLDAWRYLLLAIETGEVALGTANLTLNHVMLASSNELHLTAFREHPEFNSFRGRLILVRVPYLRDYRLEQSIYDTQIAPQVRRHVAPHATFVAALWAVLTRLRRPQADRYKDRRLGKIAADLTPIEKAELYADGTIPERLTADDARELRAGIPAIFHETDGVAVYEGLTGASPREIRTLLLDAAQHPAFACLSPLGVLDRLEQLCERAEFDYMKEAPDRGYHEPKAFLAKVRERWLDRVEAEVRSASGIVDETQYAELFDRYVMHVSYWVKNERVYNRLTGKDEDPDVDLMASVEKTLGARDAIAFRRELISAVAAWALDHPGEKPDYARVFPRHVARLKDAYFAERRKQLAQRVRDALSALGDDAVDPERTARGRALVGALVARFGYCEACARDALGEVLRARYEPGQGGGRTGG
jgi:predicted Ser/Thr protein kinase